MYLDDILVAEHGGRAASYTEAQGQAAMSKDEITVRIVASRTSRRHRLYLRPVARIRFHQRRLPFLTRHGFQTAYIKCRLNRRTTYHDLHIPRRLARKIRQTRRLSRKSIAFLFLLAGSALVALTALFLPILPILRWN